MLIPPAAHVCAQPVCDPLTVVRIEAHVFRWPVRKPVVTSFGIMRDRPALLVRVESVEGASGWGEVWCNFPACGAEHRARLIETVIAPLVCGRTFDTPADAYRSLSASTAVLAIQSGGLGPISQVVAGVDLALWDLVARRAGRPLWKVLGGRQGTVKVYASGINPDRPQDVVAAKYAEGYRAFKLKVGFAEERDLANIEATRSIFGRSISLMLDANQAWDTEVALRMVALLEEASVDWLEEPLRADSPPAEWRRLARATRIPLAAGENLIGDVAFEGMIGSGALRVVQPDIAKWGGISGCMPVIERIHAAGLTYCPHFLGAGIGLLASAHLLAARGAAGGMLEIDANENPLRTVLSPRLDHVREGLAELGDEPGLGIEPDLGRLRIVCRSPSDV